MAILIILLLIILIPLLIGVIVRIFRKSKTWGIIALIIFPLLSIAGIYFLPTAFFLLLLSSEPPYGQHDAKEDLAEMGFMLTEKVVIADTDYKSSFLDESRLSRLIVTEKDKSEIIKAIKMSPNFNAENEGDTLNSSWIRSNNDTVFRREFRNENGHIYDLWLYSSSDTISFLLEKP